MNQDFDVIKNNRDCILGVLSAPQGQAYVVDKSVQDAISIIEHRDSTTDFYVAIRDFAHIFALQYPSAEDLANCAVAAVTVTTLADLGEEQINAATLRILVHKLDEQVDKLRSMERLYNMQSATLSGKEADYAASRAESCAAMSQVFKKRQKDIEQMMQADSDSDSEAEEEEKPKTKKKLGLPKIQFGLIDAVVEKSKDMIAARQQIKDIEAQAIKEAMEESATMCGEIRCMDATLLFATAAEFKDIPCYSLMCKNNRYFVGCTANIRGKKYDNADDSLLELTKCNKVFADFATSDMRDRVLNCFDDKVKTAFAAYFDLVNFLFGKSLGRESNITQYMAFKRYCNEINNICLKSIIQDRRDYHAACIVAEYYNDILTLNAIPQPEEVQAIAKRILAGKCADLTDNLNTIKQTHIVDDNTAATINALIEELCYFARRISIKTDIEQAQEVEIQRHTALDALINKAVKDTSITKEQLQRAKEDWQSAKRRADELVAEQKDLRAPGCIGITIELPLSDNINIGGY